MAAPPPLLPQCFLFHRRYNFCVYVHVEIKLEAEALLTGVLQGGTDTLLVYTGGVAALPAHPGLVLYMSRSTGGLLLTTLPASDYNLHGRYHQITSALQRIIAAQQSLSGEEAVDFFQEQKFQLCLQRGGFL